MNEGQELKKKLLTHCHDHVNARAITIIAALEKIETARNKETKSSAGDKFETGRAMMQMEEAKLKGQLAEIQKLQQTLDIIGRQDRKTEVITVGSLVATNRGIYFLAVGIGKVKVAGKTIFCTSVQAPVGRVLTGKTLGDSFVFNELEFEVLEIVN